METNVKEILDEIIEAALRMRASDIHIDPGEKNLKIIFRVDGTLRSYGELPLILHEGVILRIKVLARLAVDDKRLPKDGRFKWANKEKTFTAEIRVSMMPTSYGENAVLRLFDPEISTLSLGELGFSREHAVSIEKILSLRAGLIMVVGPTGSGKTTTLYSILSYIRKSNRLIITVEDPIERHIEGVRQIEVGSTTLLEYVTVLRSVLRQDPDVIMIGEIRDKEGAELAIQSALTGHLVITTLHAGSVFQVKKRLINMGIPEYLIDTTLVGAISQRLVSKICMYCREEDFDYGSYEGWCTKENIMMASVIFYKGKGCEECGRSGISGRMVVSEILEEGGPLYKDAFRKATLGLIPFSEVLNVSYEYVQP